jgi:hypothetical protein
MGRAVTVKLKSAISIAAVCLGSNTVPVTVIIVIKYRAYLPVSRLIIGILAQLFS